MENIELLQCLIETEIMKINYVREIVKIKGQKKRLRALTQQVLGLKKSLSFIEEIERMEEKSID